jgi:hypothetical protein
MLRCLGSVPVRTGIRPAPAEETCTCNVCSSPRAWERVGSAPVSWIGPRSSRHPTSLEAAFWSWHGFWGCLAASRRCYSEQVRGAERPQSRCLQYRCSVAAPRSVGSTPWRYETKTARVSHQAARPHRRLWRRTQKADAAACAVSALRVKAQCAVPRRCRPRCCRWRRRALRPGRLRPIRVGSDRRRSWFAFRPMRP